MDRIDLWERGEMRELALRNVDVDVAGYHAVNLAGYVLRLLDYIEELERER